MIKVCKKAGCDKFYFVLKNSLWVRTCKQFFPTKVEGLRTFHTVLVLKDQKPHNSYDSYSVIVINFFLKNFIQNFPTDSKSASNSALFDTHIEFVLKKLAWRGSAFCKFWSQLRATRLKKRKSFSTNMNQNKLIFIFHAWTIKFLKSLRPTIVHSYYTGACQ